MARDGKPLYLHLQMYCSAADEPRHQLTHNVDQLFGLEHNAWLTSSISLLPQTAEEGIVGCATMSRPWLLTHAEMPIAE